MIYAFIYYKKEEAQKAAWSEILKYPEQNLFGYYGEKNPERITMLPDAYNFQLLVLGYDGWIDNYFKDLNQFTRDIGIVHGNGGRWKEKYHPRFKAIWWMFYYDRKTKSFPDYESVSYGSSRPLDMTKALCKSPETCVHWRKHPRLMIPLEEVFPNGLLGPGDIAAIVLGSLIFLSGLFALIFYLLKRRSKKRAAANSSEPLVEPSDE